MSVETTDHDRNEKLIRRLYHLAEAASKDTAQFGSMFADGGYFYDVSGGKKYYGADIGLTVHPHPTLSETIAMAAEAFEGTITDLYLPRRS